jgi:hypothetical protein
MATKAGNPTGLFKACAKTLTDRVDQLSREEMHILSDALNALPKSNTVIAGLQERVSQALK